MLLEVPKQNVEHATASTIQPESTETEIRPVVSGKEATEEESRARMPAGASTVEGVDVGAGEGICEEGA